MSDYAIKVENLSKMYKLYDKPKDRLMESLGLSKQKKYKEHYALNNVSFEIQKGECVGIIGTNGAGKSTILKIITGVLNSTSGTVDINGRISALLELGAGFNMEYSGIENVYLNGTMIGFSKEEIDEKLEDILSFADIGDFIYQPVKTYSSGMFVRLAFAVAINIDPEILIVDEALSVGDVFFQRKCFKKFEEFKEKRKTILFVSHDLSSITKYCSKAILLNKGTKYAEGTPQDMVDLYKKILVGLDGKHVNHTQQKLEVNHKLWKSNFEINPNLNEYGTQKASIIDFGIFDEKGIPTSTIYKGDTFTIKSKVKFHEEIKDPIFTYTIKTLKGTDITGTNTMYENVSIDTAKAGETYVGSFKQEMNLQGGQYLLSISCTGFESDQLVAYHRLYDVLVITVVSTKNTVGFYDMNSITNIEKVEE